jgi:N-acetyl-anhydromuramyl-L-alanine amidase AmpD
MTRVPNTEQHIIPRINHGRRETTKGVVIHVMDGTLEGTLSWWNQSGHEADGAHLCIGKTKAVQTADLDAVCWHAPGDDATKAGKQNGNHEYVGIEHEGTGTDSRTTWILRLRQRRLSANRAAWICYHYGLGRPSFVSGTLALHSDFPQGGHPCPGPGFPKDLYAKAAQRAYKNLVRSKGKKWTRF